MSLRLSKYLIKLHGDALRVERIDINGHAAKTFFGRHQRRLICAAVAVVITCTLKGGFSNDFVSYVSSVLSILVGLFITALIFCFDKFYQREDTTSNSKKKLWNIQAYNYAKQFSYITGYNIVLAVFALVILSLSSIYEEQMKFNPYEYKFSLSTINGSTLRNFCLGFLVVTQRLFVLYWIGGILYNTLFIVSSMVNFMTAKMDRKDD